MSQILRLPDAVANKISAGEVVQRPASVVKELLENAIDAGATRIMVSIRDAGKELIRIADNGVGMDRSDALLSVERFATSKITGVDDLDTLASLGFRGEALASICSISHFELKTRTADAPLALLFRYEGGTLAEEREVQAEQGTTITVRNLFYNVPARRKFLKSNATEYGHIFELLKAFVLAYPDIEWGLHSDEQEVFNFRNASLDARLDFLYGSGFASGLISLTEPNEYLSIHGFLGKPGLQKRKKMDQFFFVNRRQVQNRMLQQALQQAYGELLLERQLPFVLLFLEMDPSRIDVNVHPAKLEIRFDDEKGVRNMFYPVIKRRIQLHDFSPDIAITLPESVSTPFSGNAPGSSLGFSGEASQTGTTASLYRKYREGAFSGDATGSQRSGPSFRMREYSPRSAERALQDQDREENLPNPLLSPLGDHDSPPERTDPKEPKIWQIHNKYIISQIKTGIMIIDQHVAHERVLYERAMDVMDQSVPNSQQLLFPQKIELRLWEYEIFEEIADDLYRLGFNFRQFGNRTVMVEGVPQDVRSGTEVTILQDMIAQFQENHAKLQLERRDNLAKSYSCRNAIMTGQKLSLEEMRTLIDNLFATKVPYTCPHGRPIIIKMSLGQLDRIFGRA